MLSLETISRPNALSRRGGEGDVPMHGRWNTLSVLYLIFMLAPALVGVFAYMTYGTLWATGAYY